MIPADTLKVLTDAEAALATVDLIEALDDTIDSTDEEAIKAARDAYNKLTDEQKELIPADTLKVLTDAEKALETSKLIEALEAPIDSE